MKSTNWTLGKNKTGNTRHGNIFSYIKNYYIPTLKKEFNSKVHFDVRRSSAMEPLKRGGGGEL